MSCFRISSQNLSFRLFFSCLASFRAILSFTALIVCMFFNRWNSNIFVISQTFFQKSMTLCIFFDGCMSADLYPVWSRKCLPSASFLVQRVDIIQFFLYFPFSYQVSCSHAETCIVMLPYRSKAIVFVFVSILQTACIGRLIIGAPWPDWILYITGMSSPSVASKITFTVL